MSAQSATTTTAFPYLTGHHYLSLVTYRSSGEGTATPVWFAQVGHTLYVIADARSRELGRIGQNPAVAVTPCDMRGKLLGATMTGSARLLNGAEANTAFAALTSKYAALRQRFARGVNPAAMVYLAITTDEL